MTRQHWISPAAKFARTMTRLATDATQGRYVRRHNLPAYDRFDIKRSKRKARKARRRGK